jgi:hypothetical protein
LRTESLGSWGGFGVSAAADRRCVVLIFIT